MEVEFTQASPLRIARSTLCKISGEGRRTRNRFREQCLVGKQQIADERLSDAWPVLRSELPFRALEAAYTAGVVRELALREHVLAHFCASDPDVLHLMPPLDVSREQIARLLQALDAVLDRPPLALVSALALARLRGGSA